MINANFVSRVGNVYDFGVSASSASPVKCIFDRPVKKVRFLSDLEGYSSELLDTYVKYDDQFASIEFPSIYGYPVEFMLTAVGEATDVPVIIEVAEYGDKPNFDYFKALELTAYTVGPEAGTETVLGKLVSTVQSDVAVDEASGRISGTLAWIEDWTAYSAVDNTGNFLVLAIDTSAESTFQIWKASNPSKKITFDEDMVVVVKIDDLDDELVFAADGATIKTFSLRDLTLQEDS